MNQYKVYRCLTNHCVSGEREIIIFAQSFSEVEALFNKMYSSIKLESITLLDNVRGYVAESEK